MMTTTRCAGEREYSSGEIVDPGVYVDIDNGTVVQMRATDELPDGSRVVQYQRRFKRIGSVNAESEVRASR